MKIIYTLMFILGFGILYAQDTLLVSDKIDGEALGAINISIESDTNSAGEYNHKVYKLSAGSVYYLNGPLTTMRDDFQLVGEKPTAEKRMAVVMPGIRGDGSIAENMMRLNGNFTLKNIYFMGMAANGATHSGEDMAAIYGDHIRATIENCIIEQNKVICFGFYGSMAKVKAYDNVIRNSHQLGVGHWNGGRLIWIWDAAADSVEIYNNTWVNTSAYLYTDRDRGTNYVRIEHNTCLNSCAMVFFLHTLTNAKISNNIFYNCQFTGEFDDEFYGGWNDYDGMPASIISIDTLYDKGAFKLDTEFWFSNEAAREIEVNHNAYYMDPQIMSAQETAGLHKTEWMNSRTQAMFADDVTWPGLVETNNLMLAADPGFTVNPTVMDSILYFIPIVQTWGSTHTWAYPVDGKPHYIPDWPLPENLTYSDASMATASDQGFHLGDLNWYPAEKETWLALQTSIVPGDHHKLPGKFELAQNYPNPFNPSTTIKYTLDRRQNISLNIYNIKGQLIKAVQNNKPADAGVNEVTVNMSAFSSGLYFYVLSNGSETCTRKMMLIK